MRNVAHTCARNSWCVVRIANNLDNDSAFDLDDGNREEENTNIQKHCSSGAQVLTSVSVYSSYADTIFLLFIENRVRKSMANKRNQLIVSYFSCWISL